MSNLALAGAILLTGVLSPADPLVLEGVEERRVRYGWGLDRVAPANVVRLALEDCDLLGYTGYIALDAYYPAVVVDCCSIPGCLSANGLIADVNVQEMGHKEAIIILWQTTTYYVSN